MRIGGGLSYVVGPMGSGKSYYGVRKIVAYTTAGKYVVTNVEMYPEWAERVAFHYSRWNKKKRRHVLDKCLGHYIYTPDLEDAMQYRIPGRSESRALFLWDETQNDMSNRDWRSRGRLDQLTWFTQLRKLGYQGYLLSQHQDNTEAQLRRVCNYIVRLQNQKEQTRLLGMRVTPWPLFLASWHATHVPIRSQSVQKPIRVERYFLGWQRKLYDTHGLYSHVADGTVLGADGQPIPIKLLPEGGINPSELALLTGSDEDDEEEAA